MRLGLGLGLGLGTPPRFCPPRNGGVLRRNEEKIFVRGGYNMHIILCLLGYNMHIILPVRVPVIAMKNALLQQTPYAVNEWRLASCNLHQKSYLSVVGFVKMYSSRMLTTLDCWA